MLHIERRTRLSKYFLKEQNKGEQIFFKKSYFLDIDTNKLR